MKLPIKTEALMPVRSWFTVRGNSLDGAIHISGLRQFYRSAVTDNLNLTTLAPIQPVLDAQERARK